MPKENPRLSLRLSPEKDAEIRKKANDANLSLTEYVLSKIETPNIPPKAAKEPQIQATGEEELPPVPQPPVVVVAPTTAPPATAAPTAPVATTNASTQNTPQQEYQIPLSPQEAFMVKFFSYYKFNINFKSVILRDIRKTGMLLTAMDFSFEMSKGSSGISDAYMIAKIVQQYTDDLEAFQMNQQILTRSLQPRHQSQIGYQQNYGGYPQQPPQQPSYYQSYQDPRLHDENTRLRTEIEMLKATKHDSELNQIRESIPGSEQIKSMVSQMLLTQSQNVTHEDVKKMIMDSSNLGRTGVRTQMDVDSEKARYDFDLDLRKINDEKEVSKSWADTAKELLPVAGEFVTAWATGRPPSESVHPGIEPQQAGPTGFEPPTKSENTVLCPQCGQNLARIPGINDASCPICSARFKINPDGSTLLISVGKPPKTEKPVEPEMMESACPQHGCDHILKFPKEYSGHIECTQCGSQLWRSVAGDVLTIHSSEKKMETPETEHEPPEKTAPSEERLGACSSCGADVFQENISGSYRGQIYCSKCADKVPRQPTMEDGNKITGREHQIDKKPEEPHPPAEKHPAAMSPEQHSICEGCGIPLVSIEDVARTYKGKDFCKSCVTKKGNQGVK